MNHFLRDYGPFVGRVLLALLFVISGFDKLMNPSGTAGYIASAGLPMSQVLAWVAILIELVGGLMLIVGFKARLAAAIMFLFVLVITPIFHPWWSDPAEKISLLKNLSIMGGLLFVAAHGAGKLAVDKEDRELSL